MKNKELQKELQKELDKLKNQIIEMRELIRRQNYILGVTKSPWKNKIMEK